MKLNTDEKDLIKKAGRILGMGHSTFCRSVALEKARGILKINNIRSEEVLI